MKAITLFSGGKDSVYADYLASKEHDIQCLVSVQPENQESYMYHHQNPMLTELQAKALNKELRWISTPAIKEKEVEDLQSGLKKLKEKIEFDGVVSGAIESQYQKTRIEKVCSQLDLDSITPIWQANQRKLLEKLVELGFKAIITKVSAGGLTGEHLGKEINRDLITELKEIEDRWRINIAGEGGEYETLMVDGPNYRKKIVLEETKRIFDEEQQKGTLQIKKATLKPK
ncbi:diphthine--ammonia ligase [Methanonatronarchaeum sp. AMET6-2]|uniref:diphthine--ammonia ligase n=1 Tax=Methanonatronarchaeum sp. AMET6-2 TaxID=2933293 RepID=UPI00120816A4|nr:diphthine--ammonia ligase [Methanonatronarchaeum sp. AMET6-2]RZN63492.1 MAG: diphthine--ammonia ligase [Methanonatronarchaeia archaeon]UOY09725.1 diphthine--ammonia ligase [Methanonatronarchaeum sp. AMET6-2]